MVTKKQQLEHLFAKGAAAGGFLFRPILMHFAARHHGISYGEFASDHKKLVEANLHCMEDFHTDMVGLISDPYRETAAFGAPVEFVAEGVPVCKRKIVGSIGDVRNLKKPDVHRSERTADRIRGAEYYRRILKGDVPVIGWVEGPLAEACDLAGVGEVLMKLMIEPDFVDLLMDRCLETGIEFAEAQIKAGCDIIGIGDAICSQIDSVTYDTFVRHRHLELIERIHSAGGRVKLHICGDITHLLPSISGLPVDILDLDWQVDPQYAFEVMGPDVVRCGNINPVEIQNLTAGELEQLTATLLEKEKGRKFILSGGCEITVMTPPGNLERMGKAAKEMIR